MRFNSGDLDHSTHLWDDPTRLTLCRELQPFVAVAYSALAASRARKAPPRAMSWLPDSSMLFDCACLVTERLRSNPAKATIAARALVTMASRVRRGDLRNIVSPEASPPVRTIDANDLVAFFY